MTGCKSVNLKYAIQHCTIRHEEGIYWLLEEQTFSTAMVPEPEENRIKSLILFKCTHQKWLDSLKYAKVKTLKTQEFFGETYYIRKFQLVETEVVCEKKTVQLSFLMGFCFKEELWNC